MANLPKDPVMLLSYVNTQLRDNYPALDELCAALDELCAALDVNRTELEEKLARIDYHYAPEQNQFV